MNYLRPYRESTRAIVVGAWDGDHLVGCATGTPILDHDDDFYEALSETRLDLSKVFYCAKSVLLPAYRGRGVGHRFFDLREAHARRLGFRWSTFCAVLRPDDHPDQPENYRPLDAFWVKRGYRKLPDALARYSWKDIGEDVETEKAMLFWIREL